MISQNIFYASAPIESSGNISLTGTGFAIEFSARKASFLTGEISGLSVSNLYPAGTPDLGHSSMPWRNLHISGTGSSYCFSSVSMIAQSGEFSLAAVYSLLPYGNPNLGESSLRWNNLYLNGDAFVNSVQATTLISSLSGTLTGLSVENLYPVSQPNLGHASQRWSNAYLTGTGYMDRIETKSQSTNSGVFNYLNPTGRFFPPLLTYEQRTGLFSGYATTGITPFDGLLVFQTTSGQKLMTVQSGMWKTLNLS